MRVNLDGLTFIIAALACYRVTVLITRDLGPWNIFKRLRGVSRCSKLLSCPFCVSVYLGAFTVLGLWFAGMRATWPLYAMLALAFSALTIMLDRVFTSDHSP